MENQETDSGDEYFYNLDIEHFFQIVRQLQDNPEHPDLTSDDLIYFDYAMSFLYQQGKRAQARISSMEQSKSNSNADQTSDQLLATREEEEVKTNESNDDDKSSRFEETSEVNELNEELSNLEVSSRNGADSETYSVGQGQDEETEAEEGTTVEYSYEAESEVTRKPAVKTNEPNVDFASFVNEEQCYLSLKKEEFPFESDISQNDVQYPLGVVYDEVTEEWFSCEMERSKILKIKMHGPDAAVNFIEHESIVKPAAVTIYREGISVAILSSLSARHGFTIHVYNHSTRVIKCFANYTDERYEMKYPLRGLAKSFGKNILSIDSKRGAGNATGRLRVFKKNEKALAFDIPNSTNPSFIASKSELVAVTDLGTNNIYLMSLDDRDWENVTFNVLRKLSSVGPYDGPMYNTSAFQYAAGLQFDKHGNLLIGDAKGHTIKLFSQELEFLHRVSSDFPIPYMSSFFVNTKGEVLILDIHSPTSKFVYARLTSQSDVGEYIAPSSRGRRQNTNGGRGTPRGGRGGFNGRRVNYPHH